MIRRLLVSLAVSAVVMYGLAFSQIEGLDHFHLSLSVLWITLSMVRAMGLVMLGVMQDMFRDRRAALAVAAVCVAALAGGVTASRTEALVGDDAFLGSMIPHHSRAIHMCEQAALSDPRIEQLCREIIRSQRREIAEMEAIIRSR